MKNKSPLYILPHFLARVVFVAQFSRRFDFVPSYLPSRDIETLLPNVPITIDIIVRPVNDVNKD